MFLWDAIRILDIVQFHLWKERIRSWTNITFTEITPLPSAPWLQWKGDTRCSQFKMVAGVPPARLRKALSTSTENLQLVRLMAKEDHGLITSTWPKVTHLLTAIHSTELDPNSCRFRFMSRYACSKLLGQFDEILSRWVNIHGWIVLPLSTSATTTTTTD